MKYFVSNLLIASLKSKFTIFCLLGSLSFYSLDAQSSVTGLRFNGKNERVVNTTVMPPGAGNSRSQLKVGDRLQSGTRLVIPANTVVILQSPGGRQVCSSTQGKTMEYTVNITDKGENHVVRGLGAQVRSTVNKSVGYNYRVNNGRGTTSAARGTEFTFTDMSYGKEERAVISTQEGSINIIDTHPVTIGGEPTKANKRNEPVTKAVSRVQSAGEQEYTSDDSPVDYDDYSQAIAYIAEEVNNIYDPEERADNLLCLGDLYMDYGQPQNAAQSFYQAKLIFEEYYGPDDLATLEAIISMSEALAASGEYENANAWIANAYNTLLELANWNVDDLNYIASLEYIDEEDDEAYDIICEELSEIYGLIGWSYEVTGDVTNSDYYYELMYTTCN